MSNRLDSLVERIPELKNSPHVEAFRFVRQRTHHQWAAALHYSSASQPWVWFPLEKLPPEDPSHPNRTGELLYAQLLAGRPLEDVLTRLEALAKKHGPAAELDLGAGRAT